MPGSHELATNYLSFVAGKNGARLVRFAETGQGANIEMPRLEALLERHGFDRELACSNLLLAKVEPAGDMQLDLVLVLHC